MPAIVTNRFRTENAGNFRKTLIGADVSGSLSSKYVFIGKGDSWSAVDDWTATEDDDAIAPLDHQKDLYDVHDNLIAMKALSAGDITHVIPRHDWVSGTNYVAWDDEDADIYDKAFYILSLQFKVYKCVFAPFGVAATSMPIHTNTEVAVEEGDGYIWKYMYTLQAFDSEKFLTNSFMPVKTVRSVGGVNDDEQLPTTVPLAVDNKSQWLSQQDAITRNQGAIYRIDIVLGGTYTVMPTSYTILGDGTGAIIDIADVSDNGTSVTGITIDLLANIVDGVGTNMGSGYSNATVQANGGTGSGFEARVIISPPNGHGYDAVYELGGFFAGVNVKLDGNNDGDGDFITGTAFRQVGVITSPLLANSTIVGNSIDNVTLSGTKGVQCVTGAVTGAGATLQNGSLITGGTSGATAIVDSFDAATDIVYYHQSKKTNRIDFVINETISEAIGATFTLTVESSGPVVDAEYERYSGEIIFAENRAPVNRNTTQIEDVKIIIEF